METGALTRLFCKQIPKTLDNVACMQDFASHRAGCWRNPEVSGPHVGMLFESNPRYCIENV